MCYACQIVNAGERKQRCVQVFYSCQSGNVMTALCSRYLSSSCMSNQDALKHSIASNRHNNRNIHIICKEIGQLHHTIYCCVI